MTYDDTYRGSENVFGAGPESILIDHYSKMNRGLPVLDVGAGQGRHSFFLAREGYAVDAVDPSAVAIETISTRAEREGWPIRTAQCDFDDLVPSTDGYSGILIFGLIQILSWESIDRLLEKIKHWTREGSLLFVTAFAVKDATFEKHSQSSQLIGKNSFANNRGDIRTYLEAGEILRIFDRYEVVHHWEGTGAEHRHADNPPERHAMIEVVLRR